ncbi:MAG: hypothetical protein ACM3N5_08790 [Candidatus Eiseniibacteriota bacterium]
MSRRPLAALIAVLMLAGCASEGARQYATELCTFKERKDPALIAYTDKRDESYIGEPDATVYKGITGEIASAIATPRHPVYKYEERSDCYNKAGDYYYPCTKKVEVDLSQVEGIGRALTLAKAGTLATNLCQSKVDEIIIKKVGRPQSSQDTACVVQYEQFCSLASLPPAPAQPADKKKQRLRWD